jgi:glycine dehydrogenase
MPTTTFPVPEPHVSRRPRLTELQDDGAFVARHVGTGPAEQEGMLADLGCASMEELLGQSVPEAIRDEALEGLPAAASEARVLHELQELAARNRPLRAYLGLGYHGTVTPPVIQRNVLENPAWYTAYTPYQPEISQGRLEVLLNFQTMVGDLTGMDIANASLLDEATAAAEAMTLCHRTLRTDRSTFAVDADVHPQTLAVVRTRAEALGMSVAVGEWREQDVPDDTFAVLLQQPASSGRLHDDAGVVERLHARDVRVVVATDLLACTLVTPPGEQGADVVVGSAQRFGVPMMYGGPHAAFIAVREADRRSLPGRLVGVSVDRQGRTAHRLALQTREQHIRRERATSNICTSQVLLAVVAGLYAQYHGPEGLARIARRVHRSAAVLAGGARAAGHTVVHDAFFDTVAVRVGDGAEDVVARAREAGYLLRRDDDVVAVALDETTTPEDLQAVLAAFGWDGGVDDLDALDAATDDAVPATLRRASGYLDHPVFHRFRSETSMMRELRRLADRDIALDRSMIPLGSCTMKLNAAVEMAAVTWPAFADLHPFAPPEDAAGTHRVIADLEAWLADITGYDAVSLQPNAGSQGEYAGLLAIAAYHRERGDDQRDVCLIPASAHGTNAASAVMAGMRVVVVACDEDGNVDVGDLRARVAEHEDRLAALMVTYPSTHGVYEEAIGDICALVHDHGGQVYLDGANLNALVGLARPGRFGADVSHLNLHKTFCIPHGGGGPGVGPVAVRAHLAPFLPDHPLVPEAGPATGPGPVSAAPWGSAGILTISWAYLRLMGPDGLRAATEAAILHANWLAHRLADHYPVLYTGAKGRVAHECIIDIRGIEKSTGITNEDVSKRLIDYGFHAPTMSFPVNGTLMIEPTESESLAELERFVDAMVAIRREIDRVADGTWPEDDNPLVASPFTVEDLLASDWGHPYSRAEAAFPVADLRQDRYWPPVSRIDNAYGDRNLVCACPPIEDLAEA